MSKGKTLRKKDRRKRSFRRKNYTKRRRMNYTKRCRKTRQNHKKRKYTKRMSLRAKKQRNIKGGALLAAGAAGWAAARKFRTKRNKAKAGRTFAEMEMEPNFLEISGMPATKKWALFNGKYKKDPSVAHKYIGPDDRILYKGEQKRFRAETTWRLKIPGNPDPDVFSAYCNSTTIPVGTQKWIFAPFKRFGGETHMVTITAIHITQLDDSDRAAEPRTAPHVLPTGQSLAARAARMAVVAEKRGKEHVAREQFPPPEELAENQEFWDKLRHNFLRPEELTPEFKKQMQIMRNEALTLVQQEPSVERRINPKDGKAYTKAEFRKAHEVIDAAKEWEEAVPRIYSQKGIRRRMQHLTSNTRFERAVRDGNTNARSLAEGTIAYNNDPHELLKFNKGEIIIVQETEGEGPYIYYVGYREKSPKTIGKFPCLLVENKEILRQVASFTEERSKKPHGRSSQSFFELIQELTKVDPKRKFFNEKDIYDLGSIIRKKHSSNPDLLSLVVSKIDEIEDELLHIIKPIMYHTNTFSPGIYAGCINPFSEQNLGGSLSPFPCPGTDPTNLDMIPCRMFLIILFMILYDAVHESTARPTGDNGRPVGPAGWFLSLNTGVNLLIELNKNKDVSLRRERETEILQGLNIDALQIRSNKMDPWVIALQSVVQNFADFVGYYINSSATGILDIDAWCSEGGNTICAQDKKKARQTRQGSDEQDKAAVFAAGRVKEGKPIQAAFKLAREYLHRSNPNDTFFMRLNKWSRGDEGQTWAYQKVGLNANANDIINMAREVGVPLIMIENFKRALAAENAKKANDRPEMEMRLRKADERTRLSEAIRFCQWQGQTNPDLHRWAAT